MELKKFMMSAGIAALIAGGAIAQDTNAETGTVEAPETGEMTGEATGTETEMAPAPSFTSLEEMTVGDVVGFVAYDPEGNRIGEIDYVIDTGSEPEAVIGIGGFLGLGEYTVALPLSDFELTDDGMGFELATDKETLKETPEFDESNVEGLPDETPISDLLVAEAPEEGMDASGSDATASDDAAPEEGAMTEEEGTMEEGAMEEEAAEDDTMEEPAAEGDTMEEPAEEETEETTTQ
ncbi:hypothetical protein [Maritimibacter dapengensis]|uniref:PRC-barrel domain-containing protein n=1 Tax=Maritimibacter dapengensis TaxID=2836868 RepID=A0ABS6T3S9_9RHOB|nr:hypothetical protein [Maritimibacter dapengensis]MBV7379911.1 hypothetical protein [Maritimibacter dapengensis]